jgi:transcriptional regulator EpsA
LAEHTLPITKAAYQPEDLNHFHGAVSGSLAVRSHFELLIWLQGEMQQYLPHDLLIAAWGNFPSGNVYHDIVSIMPGVRSEHSDAPRLNAFMVNLHAKWCDFDKKPYSISNVTEGFRVHEGEVDSEIGGALRKMRSVLVHGVIDIRGAHDCLYAIFSQRPDGAIAGRNALPAVLPYIDTALRQVAHLPNQLRASGTNADDVMARSLQDSGLSDRELEILRWVTLGKTNPEIGSILNLSEFTIKNHLKRIFKKLDVMNRAQAVGKFQTWISNV